MELIAKCQLMIQETNWEAMLLLATVGAIVACLMGIRARNARQTEYPIDDTDWPEDYWKK